MTQLGADNRYIESNIEYGSGRLDIAIRYRERAMLIEQKAITLAELKKLGIEREYNDLDAATDEEKSRIQAQLSALKNVALQQIDEQQYVEGIRKRHPDVKTIRCYGNAFCRRWVEIAMKE